MNAFESLCYLASKERWCWKLYCTTCGTMHLRYSLQEIAKGKSPEDDDWVIHGRDTRYKDRLGDFPRAYDLEVKESIQRICLEANIFSIKNKGAFPDWLGYLGFVLEHMSNSSNTYKELSDKWAWQLKNVVPEGSDSYYRLSEIVGEESALTIRDLELVEGDIEVQEVRR